MRGFSRYQVKNEEEIVEHPLCNNNQKPFYPIWLGNMDESHQVHAFIFGLVEQRANPALVIFHASQCSQVLQRSADHSGNCGNGFENDCSVAIALGKKSICKNSQKLYK
ncbi:hypothetical protein MnTg03_00784 [bacterium MnTg03]|nr:hypothetical protein MnTg03_00784 [bacterium MnTg03]